MVFRGKHWLDGVLKTSASLHSSPVKALNRMVKRSGHYGQVKVVMADGGFPWQVKTEEWGWLAERLRRPLILLREKASGRSGYSPLKLGFGKVWVKVFRLSLDEAALVVEASTAHHSTPEPLRVARMLAEAYGKLLRLNLRKNRNL
ncbi:MAG: hypothetical protein DRO43_02310 [Candidatus Hecatellales archaeon]|nr:MAG: hypothetical protein DRO43_02310 [Candidatus Hecatellales archaeon]